jgi:RNA polymerase sigma factor (TIGR02999 family)
MPQLPNQSGDPENSDQRDPNSKHTAASLVPALYDKLRQLAAKKLSNELAGQTLSATALVHDAYLILAKTDEPKWDNRGHFYVSAAEAMRRILIDRARARNALKRGGGQKPLPLPEDSIHCPATPTRSDELLALDDALEKLGAEDERKYQLVTLRYFVGLTIDEAAEVLSISRNTAKRDWNLEFCQSVAPARAQKHHWRLDDRDSIRVN